MPLYPGRIYVGDTVPLSVNWQNTDATDLDPTDIILLTRDPAGTTATYAYSDGDVEKTSTGDYYAKVVPDSSGRWHWKWEATGTGTAKVLMGSFVVQSDPFGDDPPSDYGR